jgi:hypothetical protein
MNEDEMLERVEFVRQRDGDQAADDFAERSLAAYVFESANRGPYREQVESLTSYFKGKGVKVRLVTLGGK